MRTCFEAYTRICICDRGSFSIGDLAHWTKILVIAGQVLCRRSGVQIQVELRKYILLCTMILDNCIIFRKDILSGAWIRKMNVTNGTLTMLKVYRVLGMRNGRTHYFGAQCCAPQKGILSKLAYRNSCQLDRPYMMRALYMIRLLGNKYLSGHLHKQYCTDRWIFFRLEKCMQYQPLLISC